MKPKLFIWIKKIKEVSQKWVVSNQTNQDKGQKIKITNFKNEETSQQILQMSNA